MLLNTREDASESGARYGLLGALESLISNVFLPSIETQSWNVDKPQNDSVKADLVNSLNSFVHVLTSTSCCSEYTCHSLQLLVCASDCIENLTRRMAIAN